MIWRGFPESAVSYNVGRHDGFLQEDFFNGGLMCSVVCENRFFRVFSSWCCILTFALASLPASAAERPTGDILGDDLDGIGEDFGEVFSFPVNFDGADWLTAGAVIGSAVASALWVDEPLKRAVTAKRTPFLDGLASVGDLYGSFTTGFYLGGGMYAAGLVSGDEWTRLTGRAVLEAHTFSLLFTGLGKAVAGRSRPFTGDGRMTFNWFETDNRHWSLPSGHATSAFAISSVLSRRIDHPAATVGLYVLSCITVFNRLYDDKHWLSDTILGAAIGTGVGLAVGSLVNDEEDRMSQVQGNLSEIRPVPLLRIGWPIF